MAETKPILICVGVVVGIVAILVMVLLPMSFAPLEYYQFGFRRRKSTGSVDTTKVYGPGGRNAIGPDYEFKVFPSDAHFESFSAVTVFAADRLQVKISCYMQYFLRKEQLQLLHKNYDLHYKPVLRNNALDALKGAATSFTTREYIHDRKRVEQALFKAVRERLGGICCEKFCDTKGEMPCIPGCLPLSRCTESDYGLFVQVRYFQLTALDIPDELNQRYLQALVLKEATQTEKLKQEAQIIRKETDAHVKGIENTAAEIYQNATATSNLLRARAVADAQATVEKARSDGLKHLYSELGIANGEQKAAFDYLRTLRGMSNAKLTIDYDQLIAGGLN